ncbi:hypothetical protein C8A03DRAFT_37843 [Achaetomium macrosporum]|uniref:SNF2 N-terminal domain-containing protein n=1 Tax=Achaetomium macrosporum TaxID=79813 RepID=A0AAN7C366_9PEZI|nr:hypothetical protein C8A03DRAFT_37843 [Achaetomium macrosporum]
MNSRHLTTEDMLCLEILITSYTTLFSRNVKQKKVDVPSGSIAYTRPETLDILTTDSFEHDDAIDLHGVPPELLFVAARGSAGRNTTGQREKAIAKKRLQKTGPGSVPAAWPAGHPVEDEDPGSETDYYTSEPDEPDDHDLPPPAPPAPPAPPGGPDEPGTDDPASVCDTPVLSRRRRHFEYDDGERDLLHAEFEVDGDTNCLQYAPEAGIVTTRRFVMRLTDVYFMASFVVLDEAYTVKKPRNAVSRYAMLLPAHMTILVTATPVLNSVEDYRGLCLQIWRRAGFYDFTLPFSAVSNEWDYMVVRFSMHRDGLKPVQIEFAPESSGPWIHSHDDDEDSVASNNKLVTAQLLGLVSGVKWWLLHPSAMQHIRADQTLHGTAGSSVYSGAQRILTVRIPMTRDITLPDNSRACPFEDMPFLEIRYVEVKYEAKTDRLIAGLSTDLVKLLPQVADRIDRGPAYETRASTREASRRQQQLDQVAESRLRKIYIFAYRLLSLGAIDYRSFRRRRPRRPAAFPALRYFVDPESCPDHANDVDPADAVDPEHTSGLEMPEHQQELEQAIDHFFTRMGVSAADLGSEDGRNDSEVGDDLGEPGLVVSDAPVAAKWPALEFDRDKPGVKRPRCATVAET